MEAPGLRPPHPYDAIRPHPSVDANNDDRDNDLYNVFFNTTYIGDGVGPELEDDDDDDDDDEEDGGGDVVNGGDKKGGGEESAVAAGAGAAGGKMEVRMTPLSAALRPA